MVGGVSAAYVFVHLLPDLSEAQETVAEAAGERFSGLENHVYLLALLGLATFYGIERGVPPVGANVPPEARATTARVFSGGMSPRLGSTTR
ncbi:MAG: hypothetical protein M3Q03_12220 [Chloroflexota bacterium]|nr:hypothetical protein [Chloroflexota bacterium]